MIDGEDAPLCEPLSTAETAFVCGLMVVALLAFFGLFIFALGG